MKKVLFLVFSSFSLGLGSFGLVTAGHVQSLRESNIDASSDNPILRQIQRDQESIERDYLHQPPLVPHKIEGYKINLKFNKCLSCHSWKNYKRAEATKISQTHFSDRSDNVLANVSPRRYFCTQCHTPQVDAKPLIENRFEPVQAIR